MPLYHSGPKQLAPGDVIAPGNWGSIIAATGPSHHSWHREMTLEAVRSAHFPSKPSRLVATFSCANLATAEFYRQVAVSRGWKVTADHLYEIEKVDPLAIEHRADFNLVEPIPGRGETMEQIAFLYWTAGRWYTIADAPDIRCEEVVTPSALRVVRAL
ncbi:hypothetical protein [Bradyrhizobium cosmicum]|uniref:Uncharacterized protein n=1 Tax=Bradyrhizobium cosmicum TaxID=1404864 RepID=A0AAI8QB64_9BRAD|nr:hypothetical protein [Bradyrhizobium cosmicum]BAL75982.1 hypothetical protein S23_27700 [Bradyrhizobium cosmicum]